MENSHGPNKICDNVNMKCNSENSTNGTDIQTITRSIKIQDVRFSKIQKKLKSPQTNTIKTWLRKDSEMKNLGKLSSPNHVDKINTSIKDVEDVDKKQPLCSRKTIKQKEKHVKNNKKKKNVPPRDESTQLDPNKEKSKSKSNTKSSTLQNQERMARKKLTNIITSFTSSLDKKSKNSLLAQNNTKSDEHKSSRSSSSFGRKSSKDGAYVTPTKQNESTEQLKELPIEKLKIKPRLKLVDMFSQYDETKIARSSISKKAHAKENFLKVSKETSLDSLRSLPKTTKPEMELCDFCSCDGTISLDMKRTERNKLDEVTLKCNNCNLKPKKYSKMCDSLKDNKNGTDDSKNNSSISKVNCKNRKINRKVLSKNSKTLPPDTKKCSSNNNTEKAAWLSKNSEKDLHTKSNRSLKKNSSTDTKKEPKSSTKCKLDAKINSKISRNSKKRATLDDFVLKSSKNSSKRKLSRSESNESCDLPSFVKTNKKVKTSGTSESFKKYGVTVPSVEEILKEQRDLAQYKNEVESFKEIDDKFFELPFSVKDLKTINVIETNILDCKHLSDYEIEEVFHKNLDYISNIFHGKVYNERHARFFEGNVKSYTFTIKDLCYNTSTIVFSFEQKEHLLSLLKSEFDPDDKNTLYFFQVLLPELCLKIFMNAHNMTYDEAVKYLDTRPIVD